MIDNSFYFLLRCSLIMRIGVAIPKYSSLIYTFHNQVFCSIPFSFLFYLVFLKQLWLPFDPDAIRELGNKMSLFYTLKKKSVTTMTNKRKKTISMDIFKY